MTCEALINQFLLDYHAGTLPPARRLEFQFHLALCPDCRRYVDSYGKTVEMTKNLAQSNHTSPPPELVEAILKVVRAENPPPG